MMAKSGVLLGIDFGSGSCKVTAIDCAGNVLADASCEYVTEYAHPGWSEQNPADWYDAMCTAFRKLRTRGIDFNAVTALAFDGSTHNAVLLDGDMRPIRKTIMWTDQRSVEEVAWLKAEHGDQIFAITGQMPAPTWTLPQMMWLKKHEPSLFTEIRHILFVKDYVRYQMTGVAVTDYIEAEGTLFFDLRKHQWNEELASLAGISKEWLPNLCKPTDLVGKVTDAASAETGIPVGTPVVCGTSDSAVEDYGSGAILPGDCIIKLATAGNVNVMTDRPVTGKTTLTYSHVVEGMYYSVSATNAAALCQRWFRDALCGEEKILAEQAGKSAFDLMDRLTEKTSPGANGVMFHPYLQGERSPYWDANLRASFTGLSIATGKPDMLRALFEGVAFSLLDCYGALQKMGLHANRIFLIGGGAKSELWASIVCNVFNLPAALSVPGDASFGSALLAGTGTGVFRSSAEAVEKCLKIRANLTPNAELADFYGKLFRKYMEIHDALAPVYQKKYIEPVS